jgi:hypothetical protein
VAEKSAGNVFRVLLQCANVYALKSAQNTHVSSTSKLQLLTGLVSAFSRKGQIRRTLVYAKKTLVAKDCGTELEFLNNQWGLGTEQE